MTVNRFQCEQTGDDERVLLNAVLRTRASTLDLPASERSIGDRVSASMAWDEAQRMSQRVTSSPRQCVERSSRMDAGSVKHHNQSIDAYNCRV